MNAIVPADVVTAAQAMRNKEHSFIARNWKFLAIAQLEAKAPPAVPG
jgi:hypothetical protein